MTMRHWANWTSNQRRKRQRGTGSTSTHSAWHRSNDIEDADVWTIVYTNHRDSGLLDESNAEAISEAMQPFLDQEPM